MATFNGMLRVSPLPIPPTSVLPEDLHVPDEPWLAELTLHNSFVDAGYAEAMAKKLTAAASPACRPTGRHPALLRRRLVRTRPPAEAAKLLQSQGFKKDGAGKWQLPEQEALAGHDRRAEQLRGPVDAPRLRGRRLLEEVRRRRDGEAARESAPFDAAFAQTASTSENIHWPGCGVIPNIFLNIDLNWRQRLAVATGHQQQGTTAASRTRRPPRSWTAPRSSPTSTRGSSR